MTTNEKFRHWREKILDIDGKKQVSGLSLVEFLNKKIEEEYGGSELVPSGARIFQPNITALEKGSITLNMFTKVVEAVYKYCDVENGYFGDYEQIQKKPNKENLIVENDEEYHSKYQIHQEEVIKLLKSITTLQHEKFEIFQKLTETEAENFKLIKQVSLLEEENKKLREERF